MQVARTLCGLSDMFCALVLFVFQGYTLAPARHTMEPHWSCSLLDPTCPPGCPAWTATLGVPITSPRCLAWTAPEMGEYLTECTSQLIEKGFFRFYTWHALLCKCSLCVTLYCMAESNLSFAIPWCIAYKLCSSIVKQKYVDYKFAFISTHTHLSVCVWLRIIWQFIFQLIYNFISFNLYYY